MAWVMTRLALAFDMRFEPKGLLGLGSDTPVIANGTFFDNSLLPRIGYQKALELVDERDRKRHGLAPRARMPAATDPRGLADSLVANDADWIFALLRTDKSGAKQAGISMFLMPMTSPGISVKPIRDLNGGEELCHTFFENVRVPHANLVGELHKGWAVNSALLGLERIYVGLPKHSAHALARLHDLMTLTDAWDDAAAVDRFTQFQFDLEDHIALYEAALEQVSRTGQFPADISLLKLSQTELCSRITQAMMDMGGEIAGLFDPLVEHDNLFLANQFLLARPTTIYGGTSEVQRNIMATRVLGLPK